MSDSTAPDAALRDQIAEAIYQWTLDQATSGGTRPPHLDPHVKENLRLNSLARADAVMPVVAAALTAARCPSCDHRVDMHQPDGCWFTVTHGMAGRDLVCPCVVTRAALDQPEETDRG